MTAPAEVLMRIRTVDNGYFVEWGANWHRHDGSLPENAFVAKSATELTNKLIASFVAMKLQGATK